MIKIGLLILSLCLVACSSDPKRTRDSDKTLRVMIDPDSIDSANHVVLQNDLISSGKFYVIDRAAAYKAVKKEQERQHLTEADRFEDKQKYALWAKLYGAGGVVVAHIQCVDNQSTGNILIGVAHLATLGVFHKSRVCDQFLELVDTNTAEVISSVRNTYKTDSERYEMSWKDSVEKLISSYPETFRETTKHQILQNYEQQAAEEVQRRREPTAAEGDK